MSDQDSLSNPLDVPSSLLYTLGVSKKEKDPLALLITGGFVREAT
jgi:hypothetical protein